MTFLSIAASRADCPRGCEAAVLATGRITSQTPQAFARFLEGRDAPGSPVLVYLNSPGGGVLASMELGRSFRQIGATVSVARMAEAEDGRMAVVGGRCLSACVYALLGGRKRIVPPASQVGVHRMFLSVEGLDSVSEDALRQRRTDDSETRALLLDYTIHMGIAPALITEAERTPSEHMRILSRSEIRKWNVGSP